jgi:hypothetical protein
MLFTHKTSIILAGEILEEGVLLLRGSVWWKTRLCLQMASWFVGYLRYVSHKHSKITERHKNTEVRRICIRPGM